MKREGQREVISDEVNRMKERPEQGKNISLPFGEHVWFIVAGTQSGEGLGRDRQRADYEG